MSSECIVIFYFNLFFILACPNGHPYFVGEVSLNAACEVEVLSIFFITVWYAHGSSFVQCMLCNDRWITA